MASTRRYPVGVQSFEEIRTGNFLYVDKTAYVHDMATRAGKYYFLSRPRRFGKSLFVSTLEAYFQGRRELFEGLALAELQPGEWESHPVLHFDLSRFKVETPQDLMQKFDDMLIPLEGEWGIEEAGHLPGSRLEMLVRAAFELTGRQVVVLIDEYDAPLLTVMHDDSLLDEFRRITREFYSPLKALNEKLRFVFLTGVSRFSQLSIFSELNNLNNISMVPRYADICGFSQEDLNGHMAPDIAHLAEELGLSPDETMMKLKAMYDGYHFSERSPDVYNPYSLVSALANGRIDSYWFGSGTPASLIAMIKNSGLPLQDLEAVEATSSSFNAPAEDMGTIVPFMYQSGYLTIKDYDSEFEIYTLGIPNEEVRQGIFEGLLPVYSGYTEQQGDSLVVAIIRAVRQGDFDRVLELLRSFFAGMHERIRVNDEREFQQALYIVLTLVGAFVRTEVSMAAGRADFVIETDDAVYVVELKFSRVGCPATAEQAIEQIESRGYLVPFKADGRRLVKVGAVFVESEHTIEESWIIEEDSRPDCLS